MIGFEDCTTILHEQEVICVDFCKFRVIPHATWEDEDKPFALISDELANNMIGVTEKFKPGLVFQMAELTLEVVGYEPPINAWFVKRYEGEIS